MFPVFDLWLVVDHCVMCLYLCCNRCQTYCISYFLKYQKSFCFNSWQQIGVCSAALLLLWSRGRGEELVV